MALSTEQIDKFRSDGYLLIRRVFSQDEVLAMHNRVDDYLDERRRYPPKWINLEEKVRDGSVRVDQQSRGYRKLTHITMVDQMFHDMVTQPKFACVLQGCLESDNICAWGSGVFLKQAGTGGRQPWHRDGHSYDGIAATIWTPLMDATIENGALQVAPGTHRILMRNTEGGDLNAAEERSYQEGRFKHEARILEMNAGDTVIWNMRTLHSSEPNTSNRSRWALAVHCVTTEAVLKKSLQNPNCGPHEIVAGRHDEEIVGQVRCAHCRSEWFDAFKGIGDFE